MANIQKPSQDHFKLTVSDFTNKLKMHNQTQLNLWNNYKTMGDIILPEEETEAGMYSNINRKIIKIFQSDELEDVLKARVDPFKLEFLVRPIAQVFAQLDELNVKCTGKLSFSVLRQMERMLKDIVDYNPTAKQANPDIVKSKKK